MDDLKRISYPKSRKGEPAFKGTRVKLRAVLARLDEGAKPEDILREMPRLTAADVQAAIAFAAEQGELAITRNQMDEETIRRLDAHLMASEASGSAPMSAKDWQELMARADARVTRFRRDAEPGARSRRRSA